MGRIKCDDEHHLVNIHIGGRLRMRRLMLGLSQTQLARMLGISFQQIQKYENGRNSLSPPRLLKMARALDVNFAYFFEGLVDGANSEAGEGMHRDLTRRDARILNLLDAIPPHQRQQFIRLAAALARTSDSPEASSVAVELEKAGCW